MEEPRRNRIATALALAALCALALGLRWRGLDHSLPHSTFRDGYYVLTQVELMRSNDPEPERQVFWGIYPHLVARAVAALPDPTRDPLPAGAGLSAHLERATAPWREIRAVSAVLSVLAVAATFGIARAFLSRPWSLFAAALVAASLLHVFFAQQEKCHGPAAGTATLAILAAMRLRRAPSLANCALAGLAAGLALGTLQSGAAVLIPLAVAAWLASKRSWRHTLAGAALALGLVALCFRAFYPFYFSDRPLSNIEGAGEAEGTFNLSGHNIDLAWFDGRGFGVILDTFLSFEPVIVALIVAGAFALLVRGLRGRARGRAVDRGDLYVVLAYAVPYTLAIGIYGESYSRFVMPLVPFAAILGASGARGAIESIARSPKWRAGLAALALAPAFALAWKLGSVRAADDTQARAATWIAKNVRPEDEQVYALPYLDLPLFYANDLLGPDAALRGDMYWRMYQAELGSEARAGEQYRVLFPGGASETKAAFGEDPLAHLREIDAEYVVIQHVAEGFRYKALTSLHAALRERAERVERISPMAQDDGASEKLAIDYTRPFYERPFFVHLARLRCEGPTLEIYRVPREPAGVVPAAGGDELTDEQKRQIEALEALGYAGGTTPAADRSGVTVHDEARACAGLNLIVSGHAPEARLVDMQGEVVHVWRRAFEEIWPQRELPTSRNDASCFRRARALPDGDLFAIFEGLGLVKLDKDSNVRWSYAGLAHHALDLAPDGRVFVLTRRARLAPEFHAEKPILEDFVTILDANGRELESISLIECFQRSPYLSERALHAGDVFHANALEILDGRHASKSPAFAALNVLVSLRATGQIAVVDLAARTVVWERTGEWKQQHEPSLLANGNVLLFDNKGRRERSSALEIEPLSGDLVWSYSPEARLELYSASCGSCQRLANGDTLIVSTEQGRAVEVTAAGEIVWEYWSPHRLPSDPSLVAMLFDVVRMEPDFGATWIK